MKNSVEKERLQQNAMFDQYVQLVRKQASRYARGSAVEFEDLEAEGFLIYTECLQKYDCTKAMFSTYLWHQLGRLKDIVEKKSNQYISSYEDLKMSDNEKSKKRTYTANDIPDRQMPDFVSFMEDAFYFLSGEAYRLLQYIISYDWDWRGTGDLKQLTKKRAAQYLGISLPLIEPLFLECKSFYKKYCIG